MINLLSKLKNYFLLLVLTGSLISNGLLYYQNTRLDKKLDTCKDNMAAMQAAINLANKLQKEQAQELKLKEQEAAKAQAESKRRTDDILSKNIKGGCNGANQFLIDQAQQFHWDNNIP